MLFYLSSCILKQKLIKTFRVENYFGKGMRWHYPWLERSEATYEVAADHYARNGRHVYNATPESRVSCFTKVDYKDLMADPIGLKV